VCCAMFVEGNATSTYPCHAQTSSTIMSCVAAEAWREDSDLGQQLQALHELFGDAILPWVPFLPGAAVFL